MKGPIKNSNTYSFYYFMFFILIGSFFFVNLFIGVIFFHFNRARYGENNLGIFLNEDQRRWMDIQKLILQVKPNYSIKKIPKKPLMLKLYKIINHKYFEYFISFLLLLNFIEMALIYEGMSKKELIILEYFNSIFNFIFILEAILKIIVLSYRHYFQSSWNRFEFLLVLSTILDIFLTNFPSLAIFLKIRPKLIESFRVLRILRLFKLIKSFQGLQKIIGSLIFALPSLINVGALLFLVFFIYAILGVFIFSGVKVIFLFIKIFYFCFIFFYLERRSYR